MVKVNCIAKFLNKVGLYLHQNRSLRKYLLLLMLFFPTWVFSQNNRQNIRGKVIDKLSQAILVGVTVQITGKDFNQTKATDAKGNFLFANLAPGYYDLKLRYVGYLDLFLPNTYLASGKETVLELGLEESFNSLKEVAVKATNKASTLNKFSLVSARTFSMEEVNQYAGGWSDPARLVANFAGVSTPDDSRNDISIRGNSPVGLLWKIEGMDVTNPNHFATVGTTGGAVSALNTNMLKSSDFFTSAFPAEYGNAVSGVFDLGFRDGNTQHCETTLQFGVITGLEVLTEGPIVKGNESSYLASYRYSLAGLAQAVGIKIGTSSTPAYQDLSFKINSGNTNLGKFSFFGILATSNIFIKGGATGGLYATDNDTKFLSRIGILGLKNTYQINNKSFIATSIGANYSKNTQQADSTLSVGNIADVADEKVTLSNINFSSNFNSKINSRLFIKIGFEYELLNFKLNYFTYNGYTERLIWDANRYTNLLQGYAETKYKLTKKFTLNAGIHYQKLFLNNKSFAVESRAGMQYTLTPNSSINMGYGLHSQMQPANIYFNQIYGSTIANDNISLGFTKSQHFVLGYNLQPAKDWRIKAELYYQYLFNVPVNGYPSSYSMLNTGANFNPDLSTLLVNNGTGKNYGLEFTLEKFLTNGYYMLFTTSLYNSKYIGSDGVERNTAFNGKYVYNALFGKEFKIGQEKRNAIYTDVKITGAGGRFFTPLNLTDEQIASGNYAFSSQYPDYFRMDFKVGYKLNSIKRKLSQSFSLDIRNLTNHQNVSTVNYYDNNLQKNIYNYQLGLFPNFTYKLQF